ncbi:UpxY family transcription antiterminator [Aquimarina sp. 2201CG1-2-11]|uniref:UpxY family transcription antiterminator n=1 Tax=Aquimarina discodermiae TaxID=3231043 RepID=UPI003462EE50
MNTSLKTGWYVLYVRSHHEKKVETLLSENGLESFVPLVKTIREWSDRKKVIMKPLFPSYVFAKIQSRSDFHKAMDINGSCSYIRFGKEYAIVSDEEIKRIKFLVNTEDVSDIESNSEIVKEGEVKTIRKGVLAGLECEIVKVNNKDKILVRINSIRQNILATLPEYYFSEFPLAI